jgi:uncharacterized membrane protein
MRRTKYLDFKLTNSEWNKQAPLLTVNLDSVKGEDKRVKTLLKWTPHSYKSDYRVRLVNKTTKKSITWSITEVKHIDNWLVVFWDPNETINALLKILPTTVIAGSMMGMIANTLKKEGEVKHDN